MSPRKCYYQTTKATREERPDVEMFALEHLRLKDGSWTWKVDILSAYMAWREKQGLGRSMLSLDSFCRVLPKLGDNVVATRDGVTLRAMKGVVIV